jgi:hypothetical protein
MQLKTAFVGDTLFVYDDETEQRVKERIEKRLARGESVLWSNGTREFIDYVAVCDTTKHGSAQYTWDKTGNRCLHIKQRVVVKPGCEPVRYSLKKSYRVLDYFLLKQARRNKCNVV